MDLRYLQYIVEIGNERSISKAAKKLYISQPTLSVYLQRLEKELGLPLFDRRNNVLLPTQAGSLYIETAKQMLDQKEVLYQKISSLSKKCPDQIAIGFFQNIAGNMISRIYPKFKSVYPHVRLDFSDGRYQYIYNGLMNHTFLLAFIAIHQQDTQTLSYIHIKKEEFILAAPKSSNLPCSDHTTSGDLPCVSLSHIKDAKFILATKDTIRREIEDSLFRQHQITPIVSNEVHNIKTTIHIIEEGNGMAIIPKGFMDTGKNIDYYTLDCHPYWNLVAAYKKDMVITPVMQTLISLAKEYYSSHSSYLDAT